MFKRKGVRGEGGSKVKKGQRSKKCRSGILGHPWPQCSIEPRNLLSRQTVAKSKIFQNLMHCIVTNDFLLYQVCLPKCKIFMKTQLLSQTFNKCWTLCSKLTWSLRGVKKVLNLSFAPSRKCCDLTLLSSQPTWKQCLWCYMRCLRIAKRAKTDAQPHPQ